MHQITIEQVPIAESVLKSALLVASELSVPTHNEKLEDFEKRKGRQKEILESFDAQAFHHLLSLLEAESIYSKTDLEAQILDRKRLKGSIFEVFSTIEYEKMYMRKPLDDSTYSIGAELAFLQKFPPANIEAKIRNLRNPDLIEIETNTQTHRIYIKKIVEATTGKLGVRKFAQIDETIDDLTEILGMLGSISPEYAEKNIPNLWMNRKKIEFYDETERVIILSADKDPSNPATFIDESLQSRENSQQLSEFLEELDYVQLIASSFSSQDIENFIDIFTKALTE